VQPQPEVQPEQPEVQTQPEAEPMQEQYVAQDSGAETNLTSLAAVNVVDFPQEIRDLGPNPRSTDWGSDTDNGDQQLPSKAAVNDDDILGRGRDPVTIFDNDTEKSEFVCKLFNVAKMNVQNWGGALSILSRSKLPDFKDCYDEIDSNLDDFMSQPSKGAFDCFFESFSKHFVDFGDQQFFSDLWKAVFCTQFDDFILVGQGPLQYCDSVTQINANVHVFKEAGALVHFRDPKIFATTAFAIFELFRDGAFLPLLKNLVEEKVAELHQESEDEDESETDAASEDDESEDSDSEDAD
jgi:hypothetical protein